MAWRWWGQQRNKQCYRLGGINNQEIRSWSCTFDWSLLWSTHCTLYGIPALVRTLVLGEPPVISLLENNHKYSKDLYAIRENVQDAIRRGDMERAVRFLDGVMRKEGFFYQLPFHARAVLMDNVKSLGGELASVSQRFTQKMFKRSLCLHYW